MKNILSLLWLAALACPSAAQIITQPAGGGGGAGTWGSITGTLSAQADLQAALDAKLGVAGDATNLTGTAAGLNIGGTVSGVTLAGSGYTLTIPATGTAALRGAANTFTLANSFTAGTASSSTTTGTVIVTGGVGVSGKLYVGDEVRATNSSFASNFIASQGLEAGAAFYIYFNGRSAIRSSADGLFQFSNFGNTAGISLDFATADTLKIRNKANSADGALQTGTLTVTGISTHTGGSKLGATVVGSLPAAASNTYLELIVHDALAPVAGSTVADGGSAKCKVCSNGSAWIVTATL